MQVGVTLQRCENLLFNQILYASSHFVCVKSRTLYMQVLRTMKKLSVFGATGSVGLYVTELALKKGIKFNRKIHCMILFSFKIDTFRN